MTDSAFLENELSQVKYLSIETEDSICAIEFQDYRMSEAGRHFCEYLLPLPCFQVWKLRPRDGTESSYNPLLDYVSVKETEFNDRHEDERRTFQFISTTSQ